MHSLCYYVPYDMGCFSPYVGHDDDDEVVCCVDMDASVQRSSSHWVALSFARRRSTACTYVSSSAAEMKTIATRICTLPLGLRYYTQVNHCCLQGLTSFCTVQTLLLLADTTRQSLSSYTSHSHSCQSNCIHNGLAALYAL